MIIQTIKMEFSFAIYQLLQSQVVMMHLYACLLSKRYKWKHKRGIVKDGGLVHIQRFSLEYIYFLDL